MLSCGVRGKSNSEIAAILGLSARTVQKHLEHVYRKVGVGARSAASIVARYVLGLARDPS